MAFWDEKMAQRAHSLTQSRNFHGVVELEGSAKAPSAFPCSSTLGMELNPRSGAQGPLQPGVWEVLEGVLGECFHEGEQQHIP